MKTDYARLLMMLDGSPSGTTTDMLRRHGFDDPTMNRAVATGDARTKRTELANPRMTLVHYFITDAGVRTLAKLKGKR